MKNKLLYFIAAVAYVASLNAKEPKDLGVFGFLSRTKLAFSQMLSCGCSLDDLELRFSHDRSSVTHLLALG